MSTDIIETDRPLQSHYDKLFQDGFLINLHVSVWGMSVSLNEEDLDLKEKLPTIIQLGKKMLIKPEVLRKFKNLEGKARRFLYSNSFYFPISDAHFIPKKKLSDVLVELDKYKADFYALAQDFFQNYDRHKAEVLAAHPQYAQMLEPMYPQLELVKSKFAYDVSIYEIAMPKEFSEVDDPKLTTFVNKQMKSQFKKVAEKLEQFTEDVVASLRKDLLVEVDNLITKLDQKSPIAQSHVNNAVDAIHKFQELDFIGDLKIRDYLVKLEEQLMRGYNFTEDERAQSDLSSVLVVIKKEAEDLNKLRYFSGQYFKPDDEHSS